MYTRTMARLIRGPLHFHFSYEKRQSTPFFHKHTSGGTLTVRAYFVGRLGFSVAYPTRFEK